MIKLHKAAALVALLSLTTAPLLRAESRLDEARRKLKESRAARAAATKATPAAKTPAAAPANPVEIAAAAAVPAAAGERAENFSVSIEKRSFPRASRHLGPGSLKAGGNGNGAFWVEMHANVNHPSKKGQKIEFNTHREFSLNGTSVTLNPAATKEQFNDNAGKYQEQILNTLSLAYLIQFKSPTSPNGPWTPTSYTVGDRIYTLTYAKVGGRLEVTLHDNQGPKPIGKFFLGEQPSNGSYPLQSFRIWTRDRLSIDFDCRG